MLIFAKKEMAQLQWECGTAKIGSQLQLDGGSNIYVYLGKAGGSSSHHHGGGRTPKLSLSSHFA